MGVLNLPGIVNTGQPTAGGAAVISVLADILQNRGKTKAAADERAKEETALEAEAGELEKVLNAGRDKTLSSPMVAGPDPTPEAATVPNPKYVPVPRNRDVVNKVNQARLGGEGIEKLLGVKTAAGDVTTEGAFNLAKPSYGVADDGTGNVVLYNKRAPGEGVTSIPGAKKPLTTRDTTIVDPNNPGHLIKVRTDARQTGVIGDVQNPIDVAMSRGYAYSEGRAKYQFYDAYKNTPEGPVLTKVSAYDLANAPEGTFMGAGEGGKNINKKVFLEDIHGAIGRIRTSLDKMPDFSAKQAAQIALVAKSSDPRSALGAWLKSGYADTLNPEQIDYVTDMIQLQENAMAMRSILGAGQGSDELRAAIRATIPGASTPSKEYARAQIDKLEAQLNRLAQGVATNVKLAPEGGSRGSSVSTPIPSNKKRDAVVPRNPGESIADYLKRSGGK